MKRNYREFLRKCQFSPLLTFGTLPMILTVMAIFQPQQLASLWPFPVVYMLLSTAALFLPGSLRVWFGIAGIALLSVMAYLLGGGILWGIALVYAAMLVFGLIAAGWAWHREFPYGGIIFCLLLHVTVQALVIQTQNNQSQVLSQVSGWFGPSFLVFALLSMLSVNRSALALATMERRKPSQFIRRKNASVIVVFFLIVLAISLIPAIGDILGALWNWLKTFFASLPAIQLKPLGSSESETNGPIETLPTPENESAADWMLPLLRIFTSFLKFILPPALAVLVVVILVLLVRRLGKLLRSLIAAIHADDNNDCADYTDEIYDLRDNRPKRSAIGKAAMANTPWNTRNLSPGQQIRSRYRRLLRKHPQWLRSHTAREQLPDELAVFYERARYTDQELTKAEADAFVKGVKDL